MEICAFDRNLIHGPMGQHFFQAGCGQDRYLTQTECQVILAANCDFQGKFIAYTLVKDYEKCSLKPELSVVTSVL